MSRVATALRVTALAALTASLVWPQVLSTPLGGASWRRLGRPSVNMHLAGAATGSMASVWYAPDGSKIYAATPAGRVFESADMETWTASDAVPPERAPISLVAEKPEPQAKIVVADGDPRRFWSLGRALFQSEDGGLSWTNVSGPGDGVIGPGQHAVAVKPDDASVFAVANENGIWQSPDEGRSWIGLNENLPNLPIDRILSTTRGAIKIGLKDGRTLLLTDASASWSASDAASSNAASSNAASSNAASSNADELRERQELSTLLGADITAITHAGELAYAGSADGRLWITRDRGATWNPTQSAGRGPVERIYADAEAPRAALAVMSGPGVHVLRTVNGGAVWDDVTANLGDVAVHAAVADRAAGTAYLATDRGIYMARLDLNAFTPPSPWQPLGGTLPNARAVDVALDATGRQLFAAIEGYGLYTAPAPVRNGALRLTNAADFSTRPAAPGSVISVVGGKVRAAQVGDLKFPVLASADSESQLQVPFEALASNVDLAIEGARSTVRLPLAIRNVSPAIFVDPDGAPFLVDADSGLTIDPGSAAHPRARLQLMATGLGRVQPDWKTGIPAPAENPPAVAAAVQAYLDGVPLDVTKATLAPGYVGYYLIEVQLPAILNAGPAEFYISADGQDSNRVRLLLDAQYAPATE